MKLLSLYSNDEERFPAIRFRPGLSVIFARVREPDIQSEDSHNLGKTFLIHVLDFALLGGLGRTHPFKTRADLFGDFVFFLELGAASGAYVTIRRPVIGRAAVCINVSAKPDLDLRHLPPDKWTHHGLGINSAVDVLSRIVNLTTILPYTYRKGLGYFLRRQADYGDEFRISRFSQGKDVNWKPFVALMLGFDHDLICEKYEADQKRSSKQLELRRAEAAGEGLAAEVDELRGVFRIRENDVARLREQVATFDFVDIESQISRRTVRNIESRISELNEERFALEREAQEIDRALETEFAFDLESIKATFAEANVVLPEQLTESYEELIDFNRRMSTERRKRLIERRSDIRELVEGLNSQLEALNAQRVESLRIITHRQTLNKYKALQRELLRREEDLLSLRQQLRQLGKADALAADLRDIQQQRLRLTGQITEIVNEETDPYLAIRTLFSNFARTILAERAVLSTRVNNEGNLEFHTRILDTSQMKRETAEAEGQSYKKALCTCVDLALLVAYAKEGFYRFAYHDGIFEGFDNRRKVALLDAVRTACAEHGLQSGSSSPPSHVLTVIDADLPRDEQDNRVLFTADEIVRELDDRGARGRLFRMEAF